MKPSDWYYFEELKGEMIDEIHSCYDESMGDLWWDCEELKTELRKSYEVR